MQNYTGSSKACLTRAFVDVLLQYQRILLTEIAPKRTHSLQQLLESQFPCRIQLVIQLKDMIRPNRILGCNIIQRCCDEVGGNGGLFDESVIVRVNKDTHNQLTIHTINKTTMTRDQGTEIFNCIGAFETRGEETTEWSDN